MNEIVQKCIGKNLHFTTKVEECIEKADIIFISVNTPTKTYGVGLVNFVYFGKMLELILICRVEHQT